MVVALVSVFIKVTGFYKETLVASSFGLSELLDTYLIAVLIPSFVQNVFINALSNLFVPNYITELKTSNQKKAFQSVSFLIVTGIVVLLTILCLIFSEFFLTIVFPNHTESYYLLIRTQFYWILPCLFFWGYSSMLASLLEVNNRFLHSTFSPIFVTITTVLSLLFFKEELQEKVLAFGMLSGSILSFLYLLSLCVYYKEISLGKPVINDNIQIMISQLPPKVASGFLSGSNSFVDQFFAAQLITGSIAALNYGGRIPAFTVGMLILPLGSVLLPHFSRAINEDLIKAYKQLFLILKGVFVSSLVLAVIGIIFSNDIVRLLFERKEFTANDTFIVANIQKIGLLYIPFYLCTLISVKFLTAMNKNKFMAWTSFWNLGVNLILNIVFMKFFGIYGLALSTTIMYILSSSIYVRFAHKEFRKEKLSSHEN
ncbi:MAG: polysaccharide biosynthesis C-terminal domain-containing protein [Pyrinomonadaceae bacterium]|nr:polysaccharide biosynthesis C-terminal domain-containing protein [Sphingobacteriaceae bacterium]